MTCLSDGHQWKHKQHLEQLVHSLLYISKDRLFVFLALGACVGFNLRAAGLGAIFKGRVANQIIQRGVCCQDKHNGELGNHEAARHVCPGLTKILACRDRS